MPLRTMCHFRPFCRKPYSPKDVLTSSYRLGVPGIATATVSAKVVKVKFSRYIPNKNRIKISVTPPLLSVFCEHDVAAIVDAPCKLPAFAKARNHLYSG